MPRIILVAQEKGGLRKTFIAAHLTRFLQDRGHDFMPVDFDQEDGLVAKIYPHPRGVSISPSVQALEAGTSWFPTILTNAMAGQNYLIDAGANTGPIWAVLKETIMPNILQDLAAAKVKITLICPVSADQKSQRSVAIYRNLFPDAIQILAVVREFKGEQFDIPSHPKDLVIDVPDCVPKLFAEYNSRGMLIDDIATSTDETLGMSVPFARGYLPQLHSQFNRILSHLTP